MILELKRLDCRKSFYIVCLSPRILEGSFWGRSPRLHHNDEGRSITGEVELRRYRGFV